MSKFFKLSLLAFILIMTSCEDDDVVVSPEPEPSGDYASGVLVLNEGSQDFGSITYLSEDFAEVEQEVFSTVNSNENLGNFIQSMFFDQEDRAYIISNGSNLITVVNRYTFEKLGEITTGLDVPRYGAVIDGKAYVTNQASFNTNDDDFVAVIDLETLSLESTIAFNQVVEHIISDGTHLYVQNAAFGFGSGISVINPENNSIESQVDTGEALQSIFINANSLFALHETGVDVIDLNSQVVSTTLSLPSEISGAQNLKIFNGNFYYTFENKVYTSPISATPLSDTSLFEYQSNSDFGVMYGFGVNEGLIYIADAGDFASNGFVEVYDLDGNLVFETSVGIAPNGFYFN